MFKKFKKKKKSQKFVSITAFPVHSPNLVMSVARKASLRTKNAYNSSRTDQESLTRRAGLKGLWLLK